MLPCLFSARDEKYGSLVLRPGVGVHELPIDYAKLRVAHFLNPRENRVVEHPS